jgi:hypothetical protein
MFQFCISTLCDHCQQEQNIQYSVNEGQCFRDGDGLNVPCGVDITVEDLDEVGFLGSLVPLFCSDLYLPSSGHSAEHEGTSTTHNCFVQVCAVMITVTQGNEPSSFGQ